MPVNAELRSAMEAGERLALIYLGNKAPSSGPSDHLLPREKD